MTGSERHKEGRRGQSAAPAEVALLLYPGVQEGSVHGLADLFMIAERLASDAPDGPGRAVRVSRWHVDVASGRLSGPEGARCPDIVLVPLTLFGLPNATVMDLAARWLRERHADGATIASVCSGVFLLAGTGLLAGRSVSTHWSCVDILAAHFPEVRVDTDARIIDHGDIITAGGFMAWVELGLRLVGRLFGDRIGAETARFLLADPQERERDYFTGFTPRLQHGDAAVLRAQHWLHGRDGRDVSLAAMASEARLEERTFLRRFRSATGMSPIEYCRRLRVARARELLTFSTQPVKEIAWSTGYDDTASFARAFRKLVGQSPADYRRRRGAPGAAAAAAVAEGRGVDRGPP